MSRVKVHSKSDAVSFWDDQLKTFAQSIAHESFNSKLNETQDSLRQIDVKLAGISKVVKLQHELTENREAQYAESFGRLKEIEDKAEKIGMYEGRLENLEKKIDAYLASNSVLGLEARLQVVEHRAGDAVNARYLAKELEASEDKLIRLINGCQESSERRESMLMNKLLDAFGALQNRVDGLTGQTYRHERPKSVRSSRNSSLELSRPVTQTSFNDGRASTTELRPKVNKSPKPKAKTRLKHEVKEVCDIVPTSDSRATRLESKRSALSEFADTHQRRGSKSSVQKPVKRKLTRRRQSRPATAKAGKVKSVGGRSRAFK